MGLIERLGWQLKEVHGSKISMQSETVNKRKAMKDKIKRGIWRISNEEREGGLVCASVIQ